LTSRRKEESLLQVGLPSKQREPSRVKSRHPSHKNGQKEEPGRKTDIRNRDPKWDPVETRSKSEWENMDSSSGNEPKE
jgi:hypothetical protein